MYSEDGHDEVKEDTNGRSFTFVDCSDPSRTGTGATRRLIRQQAMKDIGRSRRRPKIVRSVELDVAPLQNRPQPEVRTEAIGDPTRWFGRGGLDPTVSYPIELDAESRRLIAFGELYLTLFSLLSDQS
jgi:hypothetical protein